jgi:DNA-binding NarL/FixJ family response regulator
VNRGSRTMSSDQQAEPCLDGVARVLVVDDHRTFSDLLALALAGQPDLDCVGTAHCQAEALALAEALRPDMVVMDVRLGDEDGIAVAEVLMERFPDLRVAVLTAHANTALMQRAARAGACCLLPKDGALSDMLQALRNARPGGLVVHPALLQALMTATTKSDISPPPPLSRRERQVLQMLAEGKDARGVAKELGITVNTCRGYVKNLLAKLGAHSQLQAVALARKHGLVDVPASPEARR